MQNYLSSWNSFDKDDLNASQRSAVGVSERQSEMEGE